MRANTSRTTHSHVWLSAGNTEEKQRSAILCSGFCFIFFSSSSSSSPSPRLHLLVAPMPPTNQVGALLILAADAGHFVVAIVTFFLRADNSHENTTPNAERMASRVSLPRLLHLEHPEAVGLSGWLAGCMFTIGRTGRCTTKLIIACSILLSVEWEKTRSCFLLDSAQSGLGGLKSAQQTNSQDERLGRLDRQTLRKTQTHEIEAK